MRARLITAVLALLGVALAAGCGGGSKSSAPATGGGADLAPATVAFLLELNTDFDGAQWQSLDRLLERFPDGKKLYSSIAGEGTDFERDVKPALGPETDALALSSDDLDEQAFVGLTQPRDVAKFQSLIAKGEDKPVTEEIEGWQVIADEQATIDRFKEARSEGTLAGSDAYREATEGLPAEAVARFYLDGSVLTKAVREQLNQQGPSSGADRVDWLSGAATAQDGGFGIDLRVKAGEIEAKPFASELVSQAPADAVLYLGFKGLDKALEELRQNPTVEKQLGPALKFVGGTLDQLVALFENEGALYVRQGSPAPEITFVLKVDDETAALSTVDALAGLVAASSGKQPEETTVAGVSAKKLAVGRLTLYYAAFDGKLVFTTQESGIEGLRGGGESLADTQAFEDAAAGAGMPDETAGFLYANVREALPLLDALTKENQPKPATRESLERLGAALLFGSVDGEAVSVKGFVAVPQS